MAEFHPSRRLVVGGAAAVAAWAFMPRFALAAGGSDRRFLTIILRGALDGLAAVAPLGDPAYASLRGDIALRADGDRPALPLDGFFGLSPAMTNVHRMFLAKEATIVHAVASPYRERSHFDGQDVLESGYRGPGVTDSGWLNRATGLIMPGERLSSGGLAVGPTIPLVMRGPIEVSAWAPPSFPDAGRDTAMRLLDLYRHADPTMAVMLEAGLSIDAIAKGGSPLAGNVPAAARAMVAAARGAGRLMAAPGGPRIAALSFDGWDTHANEGPVTGHLDLLLGALDTSLAALREEMGPVWSQTVIALVTEFGRTAHANGSEGTDHGTGTVALLVGGALAGGRVIADWPGLAEANLYQARDLAPTTDLRSVLKGVLADHLGVEGRRLATDVFPDSASAKPMTGLIRAA